VRDVLRGLAASKRIRLDTQIATELGMVSADPGRLKQVLYNYLSNAIKFTPEGGSVTIRARPIDGATFRLDVEDTGVGIKAEDLTRLFVEFQQLDASMAKRYQGTGLGLALTKRIVEAQGGRIDVVSQPGKGSTFSAMLPRSTQVPKLRVARSLAAPGRNTILVIDDDPATLKMIDASLAPLKKDVVCASDAESALRIAAEQPPGAVVADLLLPGMDGFEFIARFRRLAGCEKVPLLVWTVKDLDAAEQARLTAEVGMIVPKGSGSSAQLLAELEWIFGAKRGAH
jgi:CheY-like chemotaxis protein/anti-sigma regulatory factor (Ser/Thr protein kinase)